MGGSSLAHHLCGGDMWANLAVILGSVLLNVGAQLCIRKGMLTLGEIRVEPRQIFSLCLAVFANGYLLGALFLYGVSIVLWMIALSRVSVSVAYPFQSVGYIVTCFAGWWLFAEPLSWQKVAAIAVICAGVVWLVKAGNGA